MASESAQDRHSCSLKVLGGRSIVAFAERSSEQANNNEVLLSAKILVKHQIEGLWRPFNLQIYTCEDLLFKLQVGLKLVEIPLVLVMIKIDSCHLD